MKAQAKFFLDTAKLDAGTLIAADHEDEGVSVDDLKVFLSEVANAAGTITRPILRTCDQRSARKEE